MRTQRLSPRTRAGPGASQARWESTATPGAVGLSIKSLSLSFFLCDGELVPSPSESLVGHLLSARYLLGAEDQGPTTAGVPGQAVG